MSTCLMRVRRVIEVEVEDLPQLLSEARENCRKSLAQICRDAGITTTYWYRMVDGSLPSVPEETVISIEKALGADFGISFD